VPLASAGRRAVTPESQSVGGGKRRGTRRRSAEWSASGKGVGAVLGKSSSVLTAPTVDVTRAFVAPITSFNDMPSADTTHRESVERATVGIK